MAEDGTGPKTEWRISEADTLPESCEQVENENFSVSESSRSVRTSVSQGSLLPGKLNFQSYGISSDSNDRLEGFSECIVRGFSTGTLSSEGDICSSTALKHKRECPETLESGELLMSGSYSRGKDGSNSESQNFDVLEKQREYEAHLRSVVEETEIPYSRLSWDEFLCQKPTDDSEFGPNDNLDSIYAECMSLPMNWKKCMLEYRLKSNRYLEVKAKKKIKFPDLIPYSRKN